MKFLTAVLILILVIASVGQTTAQGDIPIGTWRFHPSWNEIDAVATADNEIYAAAQNAVMIFNKLDQHLEVLTRLNGLSFSGISTIAFDNVTKQLIIAYDNGTFDAIHENQVTNFDPSQNTVINGSKKINDITIHNSIAYLATDYGVLLFDLNRSQIKETWRDLGPGGSTLVIYQSTFTPDSVFLATGNGILCADQDANLLDYNKWMRYDAGVFNASISNVQFFDNDIYTAINGTGIFKYASGQWNLLPSLQGLTYTMLKSTPLRMLISESNKLWQADMNDSITPVEVTGLTMALDAVEDVNGYLWIGDASAGLISNFTGTYTSILPNGPASDQCYNLVSDNGKMFMLSGGFTSDYKSQGRPGKLNIFESGTWTVNDVPVEDLTSIAVSGTSMFISSYGDGVLQHDNGTITLWDETNSTLKNIAPPERNVWTTDVIHDESGLWVLNYGTAQSLHLFAQGQWSAVTLPAASAMYPLKVISDFAGNLWIVPDPDRGGGLVVYNHAEQFFRYLSTPDNQGELPSAEIFSVKEDRDGLIWVGTAEGVAYFYDKNSDAVKPIFESRFLLRDDKVKAIAIDGGNRKWMGTERGVWLFNPTGEALIENFTTENSPLPSNNIIDIEVNPVSGEVFIATDSGLASFRSDATAAVSDFQSIKIFPNPVYREYSGLVGITGLETDAIIKITDVSGKLIWQTQANGGTASWSVQDINGRRVNTGIFLVYAVAQDGSESIVGKIAVIN